ncbi:family 20 glycosylhydrolase [Sphingomonas hankookensis]|uniref:family 20 glycosylhydrolase n=1 Tax=Sphingomonas hankookensis TaxID=563996 RepID=UPI001F58463B|nr:family 20 glycosylhydrolase [Sphingomonas hankookensis]
MRHMLIGLALGAAATAPAQTPPQPAQADLDRLAASLGYRFTILDNRPADCPGPGACFRSEIELVVPAGIGAIPNDLTLQYGFVGRVLHIESDVFDDTLVNGDLHRLSLKPGKRLQPGQRYRIGIVGTGHFFSRFYAMPNASVTAPGLSPRIVAAIRPVRSGETGLENLPFVPAMTDEAKLSTSVAGDRTTWLTPQRAFDRYAARGRALPADVVILPKPVRVSRPQGMGADLSRGIRLSVKGIDARSIDAAVAALGVPRSGNGTPIEIARTPGLSPEAYRLSVADGRVRIAAADAAGANHALRSLAQQAASESYRLRPLAVEDAPRYAFRGLHVDVARNFHSKAKLLSLIEQAATYKLNKLHLHLGDDEGWRLQINTLPELTEVGAYRCLDATEKTCLQPQLGADPARDAPTNGYLTQADYLEILAAAKARGIEVIPSFDMPGHSRAAIRSMEVRYDRLIAAGRRAEAERYRLVEPGDTTAYRSIQNYNDNTLNVCIEPTYRFLDTVIDEVRALHRRAGVPLQTYHIGADETAGAWSQSPACQAMMARTGLKPNQLGAHFIERVAATLAAKNIRVAGWSDGMGHTAADRMPKAVQTNIWGGLHTGGVAEAHTQANRGWRVVLSMPDFTYLDMPNAVDPEEHGYDWGTREIDGWKAFAFMPGNLPANASIRGNILNQPVPLLDGSPMAAGRSVDGIQAQLWSETVRSDEQVDYMLFPRLLAFAERAWRRPEWEPAYVPGTSYAMGDGKVDVRAIDAAWNEYASRATVALGRLDRAGIAYRIAPPGARIVGGRLEMNSELPGVPLEYRVGTGEWQRYTGPVAVTGPVQVRSRSADGRRAGRAVMVEALR